MSKKIAEGIPEETCGGILEGSSGGIRKYVEKFLSADSIPEEY